VRRVFLLVLDSLGVGALPDAGDFGDAGAHTLDHLVAATGGLDAPRMIEAGLGCIAGVAGLSCPEAPTGAFGRMAETSPGKDTPTGHWELMNCPLDHPFPTFPRGFDETLLGEWCERNDLPGWLENAPASGTEVIARLGEEHLRTGRPIVYTSADSVFQVACHAEHFGLERLYAICEAARDLLDPLGVGRVIARPFVGEPGTFTRTYDRRDYSLPPPRPTTLDRLVAAGIEVVAVGKIDDIFAGRGISRSVHSEGNRDGMEHTRALARELAGGLVFVNLIDFDSLYGHRRDPSGYREALEAFDRDLATLEESLRPRDLVLLTADHGTDPTHAPGTDHTREYVPILALGPGVRAGVDLGTRASFADLGASVEEAFGLEPTAPGRSFLGEIEA